MLIVEEKAGAGGGGSVGRHRRRWSEAQKRQIVAETHESGFSVPMVNCPALQPQRQSDLRWRRLFRELERGVGAGRFVPVVVEAAPGQEPDAATMNKVFPDETTAVAAVDRLVHHATILEMNVESYRRRAALDRRKKGRGRDPPGRAGPHAREIDAQVQRLGEALPHTVDRSGGRVRTRRSIESHRRHIATTPPVAAPHI